MGYVKPVWEVGKTIAPFVAPLLLNGEDQNNTGAYNGVVRQGLNTFSKQGMF